MKDIQEQNKISKYKALQKELKKRKNINRRNRKIFLKNNFNSAKSFNYRSNSNENNNIYKDIVTEVLEEKQEKINYSYNIFEIIISSVFGCCMTRKLRLKKNLYIQANNILYNKLDIILYIRNMLLLDVISTILLDNNKKNIIEFLIHPKLSIYNNQKNENEENKKHFGKYCVDDFNNFYDEISNIVQKNYLMKEDRKLISLSNNELKKLI